MEKSDGNIDKSDFSRYNGFKIMEKSGGLMQILNCHVSNFLKKYNLHSHAAWEIVCQLEGETKTQVGEQALLFTAGEVLLIPPHTPHKGVSDSGFRDLSLSVKGIDFPGTAVTFRDDSGEIVMLIRMILRLITEKEGDFEAVAESLVIALSKMIRHRLGTISDPPAVAKMKRLLYEHLSDTEFSLADAVAQTGFDRDYFRRCFKASTGKTPTQYLTDLRITYAKQLLADENRFSVEMIAQSCGFSDSLYFSTCFKKHTGLSPLAYRKTVSERSEHT